MTEDRIKQFLSGGVTGDSTDYTTPVLSVGNLRHQFYFEMESKKKLLFQINIDGRHVGAMALNFEAVSELANVFSAARAVMEGCER